ncbi:hypothetical protein SUNI508_11189 [Seiridium unicorne]|uniref:DUF7357 domain-containing protein n=1 Tax=Seiridium unicorne TaxID=138068 RepID=A0ABR2UJC4_9PEZI
MASHMRLRLVVHRNGLPDANVVWPVPLENKPTIAKLLEQVNEILPLESTDWGLEDYAVELKGNDGSSFECLHFQPLQSVLKEDDQVFIRPLFTDDIRRRRVSGRLQISSDGKHLVDGIAFGRPLLKAPRGRPALDIPPRKRRRIGFQEEESEVDEDEDDFDYEDSQEQEEPMLLLTNGEEEHEGRRKSVRIAAEFDNMDGDADTENDNSDEQLDDQDLDQELDQGISESGDDDMEYEHDGEEEEDEDLAKELQDLRNDDGDDDLLHESERASRPKTRTIRGRELSDRQKHPAATKSHGLANEKAKDGLLSHGLPRDLEGLDKIGALRAAFPAAPVQVCREVLTAEVGDLKKSYLTLLQAFEPKMPESELLKRWQNKVRQGSDQEAAESSAQKSSTGVNLPVEHTADDMDDEQADEEDEDEEEDEEDDVEPFVRRFDRQGLPPGSISSGNALKAMATISNSFTSSKISGDSRAQLQTLVGSKRSFEDANNTDDDETSSSGSSSSSEEEGEAHGSQSSDDSSSESDDGNSGGGKTNGRSNLDDSDTSSSEESSDSDSDSGSDSAPEERSTKLGAGLKQKKNSTSGRLETRSSEASSISSEDSDADDESASSDESSDDDSSDSDSSSGSGSQKIAARKKKETTEATTHDVSSTIVSQSQSPSISAQHTGIPGSGSIQTKKRNARRRLAEKLKREAALAQTPQAATSGAPDGSPTTESTTKTDEKTKADQEKELFEVKRKALLDAIANGGVEVGPGGELGLEGSQLGNKRKRDEPEASQDDTTPGKPVEKASEEAANTTPLESPDSTQKRRRLDLGAGRRMLFGALGLRNPKTKDDEANLRNKLMKDVRPLQNARLAEEEAKAAAVDPDGQQKNSPAPVDEDPDAWREKIIYRAVECYQEGVELSEPPFPFVQRWDPQQQNSWYNKTNKRGGRGKRAERNQSHFYQEDEGKGKKRSYDESQEWDESYYDESPQGAQRTDNADIELNYDDVEPADANKDADETTRLTDNDDLPSLPDNLDSLKPLHSGEAQTGMVITWKQFILSKATHWQPQVLSLTGIICRIDDDSTTSLEVMLAKRDRDLEQPEKEYDDNTGQRIYEKFEAPDIEDEEEREDEETRRMKEGYRTLNFTDLMDPRIVQPAIPMDEPTGEITIPSIEDGPRDGPRESTAEGGISTLSKDTTFEGFDDTIQLHQDLETPGMQTDHIDTANGATEPTKASDSAHSPKPLVEGTALNSTDDGLSGKVQQPAETSMSDLSQVSSPSRQLQDETTSVLNGVSAGDASPIGPSNDNTPSARQRSLEQVAPDSSQDHDESSMLIHENDVITGTPKVAYPKLTAPSSESSIHSGRQLDYSMDLDVDQPDSVRATTEDSNEHEDYDNGTSVILGEEPMHVGNDQEETPVPTPAQKNENFATPKKSNTQLEGTPSKKTPAASAQSTPCSLASLGTVWCTAATSRNTQSPSKSQMLSAIQSQKSQMFDGKDAEYEDAMRKLDDFSDDDVSQSISKISDSFPAKSQFLKPPTQSSSLDSAGNNDLSRGSNSDLDRLSSLPPRPRIDAEISPPPTFRSKIRARLPLVPSSPPVKHRDSPPIVTRHSNRSSRSKFSIPPGTQILEISSDSDEPKFVEHYADDDKDENYSPVNDDDDNHSLASLPKGSGWIKKSRPARSSTAPVASQKKAPKANRAASASQSSYGTQLKAMESAAAAIKRLNKGRKASAKF